MALHTVAYLLYTHPHLARRGVLVLGPHPRFLEYISAVLPSLGETDVVFATPGALLHRTVAERAAADREWVYGHVVVDEAQELSEMDWRVLVRRCPTRSFTVVGDLAQRHSTAGARSWAAALERYAPGRWTHRVLTVGYRTPAEIMAVAADVLAAHDPGRAAPDAARSTGVRPWARRVRPDELAADLYVALTRATQRLGVLHTEPLPVCLRRLSARPAAPPPARAARGTRR